MIPDEEDADAVGVVPGAAGAVAVLETMMVEVEVEVEEEQKPSWGVEPLANE